jgi:hypothetical protein
MPNLILIVDKTGKIKELEVKNYDENELYKKAGFKTSQGFELQTEWGAEIKSKTFSISLYGKLNGRAGQENKYEFPPPIDNTLFFGSCVIVNKENGQPSNISKEEWNSVYEHLYGGFEDIGDEDSEEEETDEDDDRPRTKEGYVKDGFIVDDNEEDDDDDEDEDDYEDCDSEEETSEEEVIHVKSTKKSKKNVKDTKNAKQSKPSKSINSTSPDNTTKPSKPSKQEKPAKEVKEVKKNKAKTVFENILKEVQENYLDCSSELEEEKYV